MGNYLSKIRQNYFIGIKVPWTLSDEENWNQTHRFASWCFVAVGLLMMQNALTLIFPPGVIFVSIMLSAFWPMLYSFLLHEKKLGWMKWISIGVVAIGISLLVQRVLAGEDDWICQNGE